jgi:hypothetical protein
MSTPEIGRPGGGWWPWLLVALLGSLAVWYVLDFEDDVDVEYPTVARPTFSRRPAPAYRLAEPGDTLDRVGIYLSSGAIVVALFAGIAALRGGRDGRPWIGALAVSLAAFWYSSNPGPAFDDWHGWGWRALFDASAPRALRASLAGAGLAVAGALFWSCRGGAFWQRLGARRVRGLLAGCLVLAALSQVDLPGVEPAGFWPRWAWLGALSLWDVALCRAARAHARWRWLLALVPLGAAGWLLLVLGGIELTWYHRPLARLKTVVPGRIYASAMPTYRGLALAQGRHHFKTIINLYPEGKLDRHAGLADELRFARTQGIRYVESPGGEDAVADAFLDETLRLAQDPSAWPILVHCHACMDRTPAWIGIYRFVVQGRPLVAVMQEIERHRGYRPKASVVLLYNHVLPPRAPERYAADPTAARLRACAGPVRGPYKDQRLSEGSKAAEPKAKF